MKSNDGRQRDRLLYFSFLLFKNFKIKLIRALIFLLAYFYTADVEIIPDLNTATFWERTTLALNLKLASCHDICVSEKSGATVLHPRDYSEHMNFHFADIQCT